MVMHMKMVCIIIQSLYKYDSSLLLIVRREDWQRTDYPGRWPKVENHIEFLAHSLESLFLYFSTKS